MSEECAAGGKDLNSGSRPFDQTNIRYGSGCNSVKEVLGMLLVVYFNK